MLYRLNNCFWEQLLDLPSIFNQLEVCAFWFNKSQQKIINPNLQKRDGILSFLKKHLFKYAKSVPSLSFLSQIPTKRQNQTVNPYLGTPTQQKDLGIPPYMMYPSSFPNVGMETNEIAIPTMLSTPVLPSGKKPSAENECQVTFYHILKIL